MREGALCSLGQLTPGPVMSAIRFFGDEFIKHIEDKTCIAGQCKSLVRAKCINACPASVESPAYLALVAQGRYAEGLAIHRERNPFASICGRICPAFCEQRCRRGEIDESISIRSVKRFMADHEYTTPWTPPHTERAKQLKVGVVGAGPGGLTAALRLAQRGYKVTVFEKLPIPGGMMAVGIPEYRLPTDQLMAEVANIQRAGVEIRYNQGLGSDFTLDELFEREGCHAVVLAIGAHRSRKLGVPGEDKAGVLHGTDFLREVGLINRGGGEGRTMPEMQGKRVAVVGGGNVALDAARTAWRLGAKEVHVIYRRARADMPAYKEEVDAAYHEGIQFHFLVNPVEIVGDGQVTGVVLQRQRLGEFDNGGRRRPVPIEGDLFTLPVDVLIPAIGQTTDTSWMQKAGIEASRSSTFVVGPAYNTSRGGVFACGDAVSGPATVIEAVAQGNLVAVAVDHWLKTAKYEKPVYTTERPDIANLHNLDDYANARRPGMPELPLAEREANFREVELGLDEHAAREEARRCLRCDLEWLDYMKIPRPEIILEA
jgi:NADH-quinone oxidoreductase subunit F